MSNGFINITVGNISIAGIFYNGILSNGTIKIGNMTFQGSYTNGKLHGNNCTINDGIYLIKGTANNGIINSGSKYKIIENTHRLIEKGNFNWINNENLPTLIFGSKYLDDNTIQTGYFDHNGQLTDGQVKNLNCKYVGKFLYGVLIDGTFEILLESMSLESVASGNNIFKANYTMEPGTIYYYPKCLVDYKGSI